MACCSTCAQGNPCSSLSGFGRCGEHFADLVRAGGRTETNRFGAWCNVEDAQAWHSQAENVLGMVKRAVASTTIPAGLSAKVEAYNADFDALPTPSQFMAFGFGGCSDAVAKSVAFIERGGCLLELLEGAGAEMDITGGRDVPGGGGLVPTV